MGPIKTLTKCKTARTVLVVLVGSLLFAPLGADTIYLKNGVKRVGQVLSQNRQRVRLRDAQGKVWTIPKNQIKRLSFGSAQDNSEKTKDRQAELLKQKKRQAELRRKRYVRALGQDYPSLQLAAAFHWKAPETSKKKKPAQTPGVQRDRLWKSAVLPGWGQYEAGNTTKAALFAGGFATTVLGLYETNRLYRNATRNINNLYGGIVGGYLAPDALRRGEPAAVYLYNQGFELEQAKVDRYYDQVQNFSYLMIGVYLWNLWDIWHVPARTATASSESSKQVRWSFFSRVSQSPGSGSFAPSDGERNFGMQFEYRF